VKETANTSPETAAPVAAPAGTGYRGSKLKIETEFPAP